MAWNSVAPDGSKSVKANNPLLLANTQYIEATMENTANDTTNTDAIKDHYWNVDANLDGRHRYVNMPEYTIAGTETDPVLGASMGGTLYCKRKTAAESPDQQDVQPFFRNSANLMQLLGMHACCTFNGRSTNGACDIEYNQNITSVTRTAKGKYDVVMTNALPSSNYLMFGNAIATGGTQLIMLSISAGASVLADVKTTTTMKITTAKNVDGALVDILQGWFFCFGG